MVNDSYHYIYYDVLHLSIDVDDLPLKSSTSLPTGVTTPTSDDDTSHGNMVSGLVEKFQASVEVTVDICKVCSGSDPPPSLMLKRKKQVSRSQIPSCDKHQPEASLDDDDGVNNDTAFEYVQFIM